MRTDNVGDGVLLLTHVSLRVDMRIPDTLARHF